MGLIRIEFARRTLAYGKTKKKYSDFVGNVGLKRAVAVCQGLGESGGSSKPSGRISL